VSDSFDVNRARWDEVVEVHARSPFYRLAEFLAGEDVRTPIEREEIGPLAGRRLLHLQCHFGLDTLCLARHGAIATGLDFSPKAIAKAREIAGQAGIAARFVEGNVYDTPSLIPERFDIVYVTWGALPWLPDVRAWAEVVARMLDRGGYLYLLEGHPFALALDQTEADAPIRPTFDYFQGRDPLVFREEATYADAGASLQHRESHEWIHTLSQTLNALIHAGLVLEWLHEHERLAWRLFKNMEEGPDRMFRLPAGQPSLPLAFSLRARRP